MAIARSRALMRLPPATDESSSRPAGSFSIGWSASPRRRASAARARSKPASEPPPACSARATAASLIDAMSMAWRSPLAFHLEPGRIDNFSGGTASARAEIGTSVSRGTLARTTRAVSTLKVLATRRSPTAAPRGPCAWRACWATNGCASPRLPWSRRARHRPCPCLRPPSRPVGAGSPRADPLGLAVGETAYSARVGLRELRWRGGRLGSTARRSGCAEPHCRRTRAGRGDALLPADMDAIVARLRRSARTPRAPSTRSSPPLLDRLDAAGILVWQGVGPVDAPGRMDSDPRARRRRGARGCQRARSCAPHPSVLAWNLANEVAGNGAQPGSAPTSTRRGAAARARPGPAGRRRRLGHAHAARAGPHVSRHRRRSAAPTTSAGTRTPARPPAGRRRRSPPGWRALQRASAAARSWSASSAPRPTRLNAGRRAGRPRSRRTCSRHIRAYRATPWLDGELVWKLRDFALTPVVRRRLDPPRGARASSSGRDQPEGPVHLRRPAQAGRRGGAPRVRGGRLISSVGLVPRRRSCAGR